MNKEVMNYIISLLYYLYYINKYYYFLYEINKYIIFSMAQTLKTKPH